MCPGGDCRFKQILSRVGATSREPCRGCTFCGSADESAPAGGSPLGIPSGQVSAPKPAIGDRSARLAAPRRFTPDLGGRYLDFHAEPPWRRFCIDRKSVV